MYILIATQTMAGDPGYQYEIQDMDQTGGFIRVPAGNNDIELRSRVLDNDQAREIRKAMEDGLTGSELEDVILKVRGPDQTPAPALGGLQAILERQGMENPNPPGEMEPSPEQGNPAPPAPAPDAPTGDGNT